MRSPAEIVSGGGGNRERLGGVVVSLRNEQPRATPPQQPGSPASELGPISPELALVDPELGRAARALLPDLPRATPVRPHLPGPAVEQSAFVERLRTGLEPIPEPAPPRRRRLGLALSATGLVALGVLVTLAVGREGAPTPPRPQTQSVAAAVSPPDTPPAAQPRSTGTKRTGTAPAKQAAKPATPGRVTTVPAKPVRTAKAPATSAAQHAPALPGQTFVWVAAPKTSAYEFQLFQGGERIFRARVDKPRLELPGRWRQGGRPYALVPGSYRWYVWPVSSSTKRQSSVAIVQAKLVIE